MEEERRGLGLDTRGGVRRGEYSMRLNCMYIRDLYDHRLEQYLCIHMYIHRGLIHRNERSFDAVDDRLEGFRG